MSYSRVRFIIQKFRSTGIVVTHQRHVAGRWTVSYDVSQVCYQCADARWVASQLRKIDISAITFGDANEVVLNKIDRSLNIKNLSILRARANDPSEDDGETNAVVKNIWDPDLYPSLAEIGFGQQQLFQICSLWQQQGIDLQALPEALDRAEWMAAHASECLSGIDRPLGYLFRALKNGMLSTPPGYRSRRQRIADAMRERAEEIRRLEQQYFEDAFTVWWHELDEAERQRIDATNKLGAMHETHRREYFKKHVFQPLN